ncbi:MAG: ABC transporter transmembrane domain-containing protein [Flavobacteriales bacterium]|nr:ABC transporter transmembrane domain-containing protein [Flavobacteriales bacterium]
MIQKSRKTYEKKEKISFNTWKKSFKIFNYIKPYKWIYILGLITLLISSVSSIIFPYLLGGLLGVEDQEKGSQFSLMDFNNINSLFALLLILFIIQSIASFFRIYLFGIVTENSLRDIREIVFRKLIGKNITFYDNNKVGELQSRVSSDVSLLTETFNTTLAEFLRQILTIIFGILFIMFISWKLSLIMLAIVPVVAISAVFFGKFIKKISKQAQDQSANSNIVLLESLNGIRNVKSMVNEVFEFNRFKKSTDKLNTLGKTNAIWRGLFAGFIILVMFGSIIFVIWNGMKMVNSNTLTNAEFFQFLLYTVMIAASFGGISSLIGNIQKAVGATERLLEIINSEIEIDIESATIQKTPIFKKSIEFKNVSFHYPNRSDLEILKNINLKIPIGKQTAIVGGSGAGKSTLAQILLRFYEPTNGEILIDNKNYLNYNLSNYRSNISLVPQEIFLFGGSIYENIAYGDVTANEKAVNEAAKMANINEFTDRFEDGMETLVGDRGVQLSGGQKQRIAIARAILRNPSLLILDEATSALDNRTENIVQDALSKLLKNRTSIVIAHRLTTLKDAENILVLSNGEFIENGTHQSLISKKGIYYNLYHSQNKSVDN